MNKFKFFALLGIVIAILDLFLKVLINLYSYPGSTIFLNELIILAFIPLIAIASSIVLIKGKTWGLLLSLILSVILIGISIIKILAFSYGNDFITVGDFIITYFLYVFIYTTVVFYGFYKVYLNRKEICIKGNLLIFFGLCIIFLGFYLGFKFTRDYVCETYVLKPKFALVLNPPSYPKEIIKEDYIRAYECAIEVDYPVFLDIHVGGLTLIFIGRIVNQYRNKKKFNQDEDKKNSSQNTTSAI